jgi:iron(III) transport system substrate-binding protein
MANPPEMRSLKSPYISRRTLIHGSAAMAGISMLPGIGRAQGAAPVVWYTGSQVEAVDQWVKMFKEKTGQTVDYYRAGGLNIAQKYEQEVKAKQVRCSLVGGGLTGLFQQWAERGLLMSYKSPEYAHYPADTILPDFTGGPIKADVTSMVYNTEMIKPEDAPKKWEDLLDPKWKGKMTISDAGSSAAALHWFSAMRKAMGKSFMEKLAKQDILVRTGSGEVVNTVVSGERPLAAMVLIYHAQIAMSRGAKNLKVIIPEEGVPVSWSHICIAKDAANPEWAQKFLDFTLSREAQIAWQDKFFTGSARDDMPAPPDGAVRVDKVKRIASDAKDMKEYFEQNDQIAEEWVTLFK